MGVDRPALEAILGMALVTYATRAGGLWLTARLPPSRRLEAGVEHLPVAVLAALIAPAALGGGPAGHLALLATILVAARTGNTLLALVTGVALVWLGR